jgi:hypothetical protein
LNRPLRILIGTPCGNGEASAPYMLSLLGIFQQVMQMKMQIQNMRQQLHWLNVMKERGSLSESEVGDLQKLSQMNVIDFEIGLYTLTQESLLSRGRNHIAAVAIRQGWDKLFFIDADAKFSFQQFASVATSPHDFVAGACPLKCFPISLNYLPFQDDEHYYRNNIRSVDSFLKMKEGHGKKHVPIAFIGTAFMCLSRNSLIKMAEISDEYQYPNPATGHTHTHWDIFSTRPMDGKYMSEDWSACQKWRDLGGEVLLDTDVIISHVGNHVFGPEQAHITHKSPGIDVNQGQKTPRAQ